jgi:outer membrane protein assembly factor BamB
MFYKEKKEMSNRKMKSELILTIFLMLTIAMSVAVLPFAIGQTKLQSWAYVAASPNVAGLGQSVFLSCWTSPIPPASGATAGTQFKNGYVITITYPNATTMSIPLRTSYEDGTSYTTFIPDVLGTYSVVLYWPGDNTYAACTSPPTKFTVQQEPASTMPLTPIPTQYWERPVPADIRGMAGQLASWPQTNYDPSLSNCNPYTVGPISSHILWTNPGWPGGIVGGAYGDQQGASSYVAGKNTGVVVLMGEVFQTIGPVTYCYSAYTGELLWSKTFNGTVSYGILPGDANANLYRGAFPVLYVATTGNVQIFNAVNGELLSGMLPLFQVSSTSDSRIGITAVVGGYIYYVGGGFLTKWNPFIPGADLNASSTFTTNTLAYKLVYRVALPTGVPTPSLFWNDVGISSGAQSAFNLTTGQLMWRYSGSDTILGQSIPRTGSNDAYHEGSHCVGDGKYYEQVSELGVTVAFNLYTGNLSWVSPTRDYPYGSFTAYQMGCGNGKVYTESYDGHVYAYDDATGAVVWKFYSGDSGATTAFGTWPFWANPAIIPGMVYANTGEHTVTNPRYAGDKLYCINDNTGTEIWSIGGAWGGKSVAESKLFAYNDYTGDLYAFGRGPSAATVTVSNKVLTAGSRVLIEGTVTDQATGQQGTPCVSEASMSAWMEYLYLDRPKPTDATGVPVTLSYLGPDGNSVDIATVMSDSEGFRYEWTPPTTNGVYQVFATFNGTTSYFGSQAATALSVGPAPATPAPTATPIVTATPITTTTEQPFGLYILGSTIAIIATIVIVGAILRMKKP